MENQNDVIDNNTPAPVQGARVFTQDELNALLAEERRRGEARVEAIRTAAVADVAKARGVPSSTRAILDARRAEDLATELEREEVLKFFKGPNSGRLSSDLYKNDPAGYGKIRALAVKHKILGDGARPVTGTSRRGFNPTS